MDKKKKPSDAFKRKQRQEREDSKQKLPKIDKFFSQPSASTSSQNISIDSDSNSVVTAVLVEKPTKEDSTIIAEPQTSTFFENVYDKSSYDLGNFTNKILSDNEKRQILDMGPLQPPGPFPADINQNNRCFSKSYYVSCSTYGPVNRFWLCYSKILDAAYGEPCWLFASQRNNVWCTGIRDWKHLSERIKQHSCSSSHSEACAVYEFWKKNDTNTIDKELENEIHKEASFWKMVLQRLFDIILTLTLAKSSLALRGHQEDLSQEGYHGNFLSFVELVARYDHILRQVLDMPKGSTRYLSATIQNEMIESLGTKLETHLLEQIRASPFFAIIMDITQDISKVDQLSIVVRYAVITRSENGQPIDIEVKELFLGFYAAIKHGAVDLVNQVTTLFIDKNIDLKKCVGQGYDGASVMSGDIQPNAEYVHCATHNLNLVINDAVSSCVEIQIFFATLQDLYNFFGNSIKRWYLLSKFTGESETTLKKLNPTRYPNKDERSEAESIKTKMLNFEFELLCEFMHSVLNDINYASKTLQKCDINLGEASKVLAETKTKLQIYRNDFELFKCKASETARKYGIDTHFQEKRQRKVKKHFDELAADHRFPNREKIFKIEIFNNVLDTIISQLDTRFIGMSAVSHIFDFLTPTFLLHVDEATLLQKCDEFQRKYSDIIGPTFSLQFINIYHLVLPQLAQAWTVHQLCKEIMSKYGVLECDLTEVFTAMLLFFTIPVTSAAAERSFSKLKLIKNYLRNNMGQTRLRHLSLIAIENKTASSLDLNEVIDTFAKTKARKKL
ncbi:hypothetical protein K1T71_009247 [Dendrolimus kikuchii]|uniref:Uncharacterized protein n=1 Tax=Dendrolimus kikuchii TaxID=765133 RepID=A0ACC1CU48_9NEOP|nr:hypothetical protein K1T71_009247 [Dendrolimus kikuchii]